MTEHDFHPSRRIARSTPNSPGGDLAPRIRTLATDSVTARDRSLPAALCTVAAEVGFEAANGTDSANAIAFADLLEPVVTTVTLLEGYVRLRLTLVDAADAVTVTGSATDRDGAILASDFLHASAYATIAETPVSDRRRLELYRLLLEGSTTLTQQCLARSDADEPVDPGERVDTDERTDPDECAGTDETVDGRFEAAATLAETAGAIGAATVGASTETRRALRRYSHAMMTALASQSSATSDDDDPRASAARVLFDPTCQHAVVTDEELAYATPAVERSLERARTALEALVDDVAGSDDVSSPLGRLERATRVPFHRE